MREPLSHRLFPTPDLLTENLLITYIEGVLKDWDPFPLHHNGRERSWDDYLFLLLQVGCKEVMDLHEAMYTGILAPYRNSNLAVIRHLTLGSFNENVDRYKAAQEEAESLHLDYKCLSDRVHLVKINEERTRIVWSKEFLF